MKAMLGLTKTKALAWAGAGVLSAGLVGGMAFAANPAPADTSAAAEPAPTTATTADRGGHADKLKDVLDGLVSKGVITRAQADAIVDALKKADGDHKRPELKQLVGDVFKESLTYLGLTGDQLKAELAKGKSLAEIANATPGKTRQGLVDYLTKLANDRIAQAVKDGKITAEQGEKARTTVDAAIVRLIDHERGGKPAPKKK